MDTLAWRLWYATPDGWLVSPSQASHSRPWPGRKDVTAECAIERFWLSDLVLARAGQHAAPGERCFCGIHGVTDLRGLLDYPLTVKAKHPVIGVVALSGTVLPATVPNDPTSSVRAERARITGPLFMAHSAAHKGARIGFLKHYGVPSQLVRGDLRRGLRLIAERAAGDSPWTPEAVLNLAIKEAS